MRYIPFDPMAPFLYAVRVVRGECPRYDKYCVAVPEPTTPRWLEPSAQGSADGIGLDQPARTAMQMHPKGVAAAGVLKENTAPSFF